MASVQQYTFWSVTINNPDDNDLLIVRNPNDRYVRQVVWTNEVGAEGTPHVQMWVRLHRNNSLSLLKRLYPRGHLKGIAKDEYNENCHAYAQKDDDTTHGAHVLTNVSGPPDAVNVLQQVIARMFASCYPDSCPYFHRVPHAEFEQDRRGAEDWLVIKKPYLAKVMTSSGYKQVVERFMHVLWNEHRKILCQVPSDNTTTQHAPVSPNNNSRPLCINGIHQEEGSRSPSPHGSSQEDCSTEDDSSEGSSL